LRNVKGNTSKTASKLLPKPRHLKTTRVRYDGKWQHEVAQKRERVGQSGRKRLSYPTVPRDRALKLMEALKRDRAQDKLEKRKRKLADEHNLIFLKLQSRH
jgi:hypothetical protein